MLPTPSWMELTRMDVSQLASAHVIIELTFYVQVCSFPFSEVGFRQSIEVFYLLSEKVEANRRVSY